MPRFAETLMEMERTVAAVSTPRGTGGVAVIRISGPDAGAVADRVFTPASGGSLLSRAPRTAVFGTVGDADGREVDRAVATFFRAPASFTGEDTAEISCHGGAAVTRAVLSAVLAAGAFPAGPGEFTRRAFINGKISLTEAEATGLLIAADTDDRLALAAAAAGGKLRERVAAIGSGLADAISLLCAVIDYPDELISDDGSPDGEAEILAAVREAREGVAGLLETYRRGSAVADGVRTVICGAPNVGKSSLFNALTGGDDAIVTDVPGTTRDVLRKTVAFGGVTLLLSDTAGLREIGETVEKIGVERARREIGAADLIIAVFDSSRPLTDGEKDAVPASGAVSVAVMNKTDLPRGLTEEDEEFLREKFTRVVSVSCRDGMTDGLRDAIADLFDSDRIDLSGDPVIWDARQRADLAAARDALAEAEKTLASGGPPDAACALCEEAAAKLAETDGRGVGEEVLARIFSRFCVGK